MNIDNNYQPSLCIPRVNINITREMIMYKFRELNIGFIKRIDMIAKKSDCGNQFYRVFVHIKWNNSEKSCKARQFLLDGKEIKIIYEEPWFWKLSVNKFSNKNN